jgi:polyhydroxyalkanoate synthesis repressor PhaR
MGNLRQINKYGNRRLYDKDESRYVTLADVYRLILDEVEFVVIDNDSQRDITDHILLQVMSKQERSDTPMLGREFLLHTIRMYGSPLKGGPANRSGRYRDDVGARAFTSLPRTAGR